MMIDRVVPPRRRRLASHAGLALLGLWAAWWALNLRSQQIYAHQWLLTPASKPLGFDFIYCDQASRYWLAGGNPYLSDFGDPEHRFFVYPPICLPSFAWSSLVRPRVAVLLWTIGVASIIAVGVRVASRARREAGLGEVSQTLTLAAVMFSTPVVFAMARGNCDVVPLAMILLASGLLAGRPSAWRDLLAGGLLAVAFSFKIYPGVLAIGLAALRRWRALGGFAACCVLIWSASPHLTREFLEANARYLAENLQYFAKTKGRKLDVYYLWSHSLSYGWKYAGFSGGLAPIRGEVVALLLVMPVIGYVSWQVSRRDLHGALILPYFAWITALATFVPQISNDYNLIFLPIAAIVIIDIRDNLFINCLMLSSIVWLQPFYSAPPLPRGGLVLLVLKFVGTLGVGLALLARVRACSCRSHGVFRNSSCPGLPPERT